jgi:hypothetical protein
LHTLFTLSAKTNSRLLLRNGSGTLKRAVAIALRGTRHFDKVAESIVPNFVSRRVFVGAAFTSWVALVVLVFFS